MNISSNPRIIGISGTNGSGKDSLGHLLQERADFVFISMTDLLREEALARGLKPDRQVLRTISAEWRKELGLGVLIDKALELCAEKYPDAKGLAVASLRNPGEADHVHELGGEVVWLDADPQVRYQRIQGANRGRAHEDEITFDEFLEHEAAEMTSSGDETTLAMSGVRDRADIVLVNDENGLDQLAEKIFPMLRLPIS